MRVNGFLVHLDRGGAERDIVGSVTLLVLPDEVIFSYAASRLLASWPFSH
jgi:hypothetical protein